MRVAAHWPDSRLLGAACTAIATAGIRAFVRLEPFSERDTMASIYREFIVNAPPPFVWEAIRDVGAVHRRLAKGFVTDTRLEGDTRTVTFANGLVVREQIVSTNDELRRLVYRIVEGKASHHNAFFQVLPRSDGSSKILWVTDLLPDEMRAPIEQMVDLGSAAIQRTIEQAFHGSGADDADRQREPTPALAGRAGAPTGID